MDTLLSQRMRHILSIHGAHDLSRADDHEMTRQFHQMIRCATRLRSIGDIETAIEFLSARRPEDTLDYARLFETAVDLLSFDTPKDAGLLYSGQYSYFASYSMRGDTSSGDLSVIHLIEQFADSTVKMKTEALAHARAH